jgi:putative transposase
MPNGRLPPTTTSTALGTTPLFGAVNYFVILFVSVIQLVVQKVFIFCSFLQSAIELQHSISLTRTYKKCMGIDVGLKDFYADNDNNTVEHPKSYRKSQKRLNRLNWRKSQKFRRGEKQSNNYIKTLKG